MAGARRNLLWRDTAAVTEHPKPASAAENTAGWLRGLDRLPPPAIVVTAILSIQLGAAVATELFESVGPSGATFLRLALGLVVLLIVGRPRLWGRTRRELLLGFGFGVTLGVTNLLFYEALDRLDLGIAVTIEFIGPIGLAALLSRKPFHFLWVALAGAGIVLLAAPWAAESVPLAGVAFAAGAGLFWALYIVLAQRAGAAFEGFDGLGLGMVFATLIVLVPGVAEGGSGLLALHVLLIGLAAAVLSSTIPYVLETEALRRMPARIFSVMMSLEPAAAAVIGLIVLGQLLSLREAVAVAMVVVAGVGVTRDGEPPPPQAAIEA